MDGKFNTKEFKSQIRKLFESEDMEGIDAEEPVIAPIATEDPSIEKEELSAIGGIADASAKISDAAATLKAVEDLEAKGVVSGEAHESAEYDALSELDMAIDELIAAKSDMQAVEDKEDALETSPENTEIEPESVEDKITAVDNATSDEEKEDDTEEKK